MLLSSRLASETRRRHDLEMGYPWARKTELAYTLDKKFSVIDVPADAALKEPFGTYTRTVRHEGQSVTIIESFELLQQRISTAEYERFRAFCNKVDSLLEQKVTLEQR
jgi:hypothetical protein